MTTTFVVRYSIITMAGMAIDDVRYATMMMLFRNSRLKYHLLMANMIMMLIFLGNWLLNKNLHALNFLKMLGLEQPLVNSLILLLFGGWNMARNILMTYHKLGLLFLSIKIMQILLVCFILLVKLKGKCRVATQVQRLILLQEELIHGSATMDVQPTVSFTKSGGTFYVQQQQQASNCCHKLSNSGALSNKEYPTTHRVCYIFK
jgi:hypothetical protein